MNRTHILLILFDMHQKKLSKKYSPSISQVDIEFFLDSFLNYRSGAYLTSFFPNSIFKHCVNWRIKNMIKIITHCFNSNTSNNA